MDTDSREIAPMILIASTNPGKLVEMQELFTAHASRPFRLATPDALEIRLDVKEDGQTYAENAVLKARAYAQASGLITLADDSGLEVQALEGRPGLYSARYTGGGAYRGGTDASARLPGAAKLSDAERREALLAELSFYPSPWPARFFCAAALACPDETVIVSEGTCQGEIIPVERGEGGFGYDPIFQLTDEQHAGLTMAELSLDQKNRISHRAVAVRQVIEWLENRLDQGLNPCV